MPPSSARRVGAYGKLLANYASDDAVMDAGEAAELLFVRGIAFCSTSDSDGYMTDAQVLRYVGAGMRDAKKRAERLVEVGLWLKVEGGYVARSHTKIHETAEEKGYKLKADRERKKANMATQPPDDPAGFQTESERNPDGIRETAVPDSLSMTVHNRTETEQNTTGQDTDSGTESDRAPAQRIIGSWIEHCATRPPKAIVGQVSRQVSALLTEGIDPDAVNRGVAAWAARDLAPSLIPSFVNGVLNPGRNRHGTAPPATGASAKARGWLELADPATPQLEERTR